jgi:FkbM family methyltransferase
MDRNQTVNIEFDNGVVASFASDSAVNHASKSESVVLNDFITEMGEDKVFYDVGSHQGLYTIFAKLTYPGCDVVAFEASEDNQELLEVNVKVNDIDSVVLVEGVVSNEDGEVEFADADNSGINRMEVFDDDETVTKNMTTIETAILNHNLHHPDIMKIDVEGAEYQVLDGMRNLLEENIPETIYIEVHNADGGSDVLERNGTSITHFEGSGDDIRDMLEGYGYSVNRINERPNTVHIKAYAG